MASKCDVCAQFLSSKDDVIKHVQLHQSQMLPLIKKLSDFGQESEAHEIAGNDNNCNYAVTSEVLEKADKAEFTDKTRSALAPQSNLACPNDDCHKHFTRRIDLVRHYGTRMLCLRAFWQELIY
jgi:hypothetical protein